MKRAMVVWCVVIAALGCSTPYQRSGFRGGYSDSRLGPGRYAVEVNVNSFTSSGTALRYLHRRATELCPTGYDVVDSARGSSDHYVRTGNTIQNLPKAEVSAIVQCKAPRPPAPPANPLAGQAWWCYEGSGGLTSGCRRSQAECEGDRAGLKTDLSPCAWQERVACYGIDYRLAGATALCFASFRSCNASRDYLMTSVEWKDDATPTSECGER